MQQNRRKQGFGKKKVIFLRFCFVSFLIPACVQCIILSQKKRKLSISSYLFHFVLDSKRHCLTFSLRFLSLGQESLGSCENGTLKLCSYLLSRATLLQHSELLGFLFLILRHFHRSLMLLGILSEIFISQTRVF